MGYEAFGTIRWSHPDRCGILFDEPIAKEWVLATREYESVALVPSDRELNRINAREWVTGRI